MLVDLFDRPAEIEAGVDIAPVRPEQGHAEPVDQPMLSHGGEIALVPGRVRIERHCLPPGQHGPMLEGARRDWVSPAKVAAGIELQPCGAEPLGLHDRAGRSGTVENRGEMIALPDHAAPPGMVSRKLERLRDGFKASDGSQ